MNRIKYLGIRVVGLAIVAAMFVIGGVMHIGNQCRTNLETDAGQREKEMKTLREPLRHVRRQGEIGSVTFSSDNRLLVLGGEGSEVTAYNIENNSHFAVIGPGKDIVGLAFLPRGEMQLLVSTLDGNVYLWNLATKSCLGLASFSDRNPVFGFVINELLELIVPIHHNTDTKPVLLDFTLSPHRLNEVIPEESVAAFASRDGNYLYSLARSGRIEQADIATRKRKTIWNGKEPIPKP